jgi:hypothetical protein
LLVKWKEDLADDLFVLNSIWDNIVEIRGKNDNKLNNLKSLIQGKIENPIENL